MPITDKTADQITAHRMRQQREVDNNYEIFTEKYLPEIFEDHPGEYALMKNGEMLGIFDDMKKAVAEGRKRFEDRIFSAHRITKEVFDLGIYSRFLKK